MFSIFLFLSCNKFIGSQWYDVFVISYQHTSTMISPCAAQMFIEKKSLFSVQNLSFNWMI